MITMNKWAIRHKPTGYFMPQTSSKRHGYTNDEPAIMIDSNLCPRLFGREQDAKTALTWWLKGITTVSITGGVSNFNLSGDDEYNEQWNTLKPDEYGVARDINDFEVVKLELRV